MSGHSKWASIKHKKGAADAKRGKLFTRIIKELTVAARDGGGDPDSNPRLRTVIADAKAANMPQDNIKRAIRRGTGEEPGVSYEEVTYEAYGPGGVALLIEVLTDNTNRAVGEIRHLLSKHGGNLGTSNSVAWMFDKQGYIVVEKTGVDEETLMSVAIDAGADDFQEEGDTWEVVSAPEVYDQVLEAVKTTGVVPVSAQLAMLPKNHIKIEGKQAQQLLKLMDLLEDQDDVQHVWSNFDIDIKEIEASLA
jgi:YebC/PmpR family DNA-binding regulatory protein